MAKKISSTISSRDAVLPGLLKELRGSVPQEDFYPKFGVRIATGKNWEYGVNVPKLSVFFGLCKMLGYEGLKRLGYNLGEIMDVLRGDMSETRREAHHWVEEIFRSAPEEMQKHVLFYLRERGGKYGGKP